MQIGDDYVGGELAGKQPAGQATHEQQQQDRHDPNEQIRDDQPVAQPPHEGAIPPAAEHDEGDEDKDYGGKDRPPVHFCSEDVGNPKQQTKDAQPQGKAAPLSGGTQDSGQPGPDSTGFK